MDTESQEAGEAGAGSDKRDLPPPPARPREGKQRSRAPLSAKMTDVRFSIAAPHCDPNQRASISIAPYSDYSEPAEAASCSVYACHDPQRVAMSSLPLRRCTYSAQATSHAPRKRVPKRRQRRTY